MHQLETVQKANGAMVRVLDLLEVEATIVDAGHDVAAAGRARRVVPRRVVRLRRPTTTAPSR